MRQMPAEPIISQLKTGHSENKMLTSLSKPESELRPAVIVAVILSEIFCWLELQAAQYLLQKGSKLYLYTWVWPAKFLREIEVEITAV